MDDKKQNIYKSDGSMLEKEITSDLAEQLSKFKDPVVLGELVYKLLEERENTNRILKTLLRRIEELQNKKQEIQENMKIEEMLPKIDEEIMNAVKELGNVTAQQIQEKFNYKGKNGASSRLNRLYSLGFLTKKQVGRKVYFLPK